MTKQATQADTSKVAYEVRKSRRARRMRLAVYCDGSVVVTAPWGLQQNYIERFVGEKAGWLRSKVTFFKQFRGTPLAIRSQAEYEKYKEPARQVAEARVAYLNQFYGFSYNNIAIKNQKTRWGSCSRKGNLNFNYKIALLPPALVDYIVVHELCHLKEFNHSPRFWALVAEAIPDYADFRNEIRKIGLSVS